MEGSSACLVGHGDEVILVFTHTGETCEHFLSTWAVGRSGSQAPRAGLGTSEHLILGLYLTGLTIFHVP